MTLIPNDLNAYM